MGKAGGHAECDRARHPGSGTATAVGWASYAVWALGWAAYAVWAAPNTSEDDARTMHPMAHPMKSRPIRPAVCHHCWTPKFDVWWPPGLPYDHHTLTLTLTLTTQVA